MDTCKTNVASYVACICITVMCSDSVATGHQCYYGEYMLISNSQSVITSPLEGIVLYTLLCEQFLTAQWLTTLIAILLATITTNRCTLCYIAIHYS